MLDHVTIGVSDIERSKTFYDSALRPLGIERLYADGPTFAGYGVERKAFFWIGLRDASQTSTHVASASARFDEARKRRVGYELSLVLSGMWPVSCVNPSVLQNTSLRRWQPVSMDRGPNS